MWRPSSKRTNEGNELEPTQWLADRGGTPAEVLTPVRIRAIKEASSKVLTSAISTGFWLEALATPRRRLLPFYYMLH